MKNIREEIEKCNGFGEMMNVMIDIVEELQEVSAARDDATDCQGND